MVWAVSVGLMFQIFEYESRSEMRRFRGRSQDQWRGCICILILLLSIGQSIQAQGPDDCLNSGLGLLTATKYDEALAAFDQCKQKNPRDPRFYIYSGITLLRSGRAKDASVELNLSLRFPVSELDDAVALSRALDELGRTELAADLLNRWGGSADLEGEGLWYLADLHFRMEEFGKALKTLEEFAVENPEDQRIPLRRGELQLATGNLEEALSSFRRAVELEPDSSAANFGPAKTIFLQIQGETLFSGGNETKVRLSRALDLAEKAVSLEPENVSHLHLAGNIAASFGEVERGVNWLEKAVELAARSEAVNSLDLSRVFRQAENREKARRKMFRYQVLTDLSRAYSRLGESRKAGQTLTRLQQLTEEEERERVRLLELQQLVREAQQMAAKGNLKEAVTNFNQALELDPDNWWLHNYLARIYLMAGYLDLAHPHIKKTLELDPGASDGHFMLASYLFQLERNQEALKQAEEARRLRPGKPELRKRLGDIYTALDRPDAAKKEYLAARLLGEGIRAKPVTR